MSTYYVIDMSCELILETHDTLLEASEAARERVKRSPMDSLVVAQGLLEVRSEREVRVVMVPMATEK